MHVVYMGPTERGEKDKFLWFLIRHQHLQIGITKIETIQDKIDTKIICSLENEAKLNFCLFQLYNW